MDPMHDELTSALERGADGLSAREVARLEDGLRNDPSDLVQRAHLLGYYSIHGQVPDVHRHLVYLIRACPAWDDLPGFLIKAEATAVEYVETCRVWDEVAAASDDPRVIMNAFRFVGAEQFADGVKLLDRGMALTSERRRVSQDDECTWQRAAGLFFLRHGRRQRDEKVLLTAAQYFKRALFAAPTELLRAGHLPIASMCFYKAREVDDALACAIEMISARGFMEHAQRHWGHGVLGLLALEDGNVQRAIAHLEMSVPEAADFHLEYVGPYLELGAELHRAGYRTEVRSFLVALRAAWNEGTPLLQQWIDEMDAGAVPGFVLSDDYGVDGGQRVEVAKAPR